MGTGKTTGKEGTNRTMFIATSVVDKNSSSQTLIDHVRKDLLSQLHRPIVTTMYLWVISIYISDCKCPKAAMNYQPVL